jgi:hypothetical protein
MKPFYRYTKLSDQCHCGSAQPYRECCFHSDLIGFAIALIILAALLFLPSESLLYRIVRGGFGLLTWVCVFFMVRDWFRQKKKR